MPDRAVSAITAEEQAAVRVMVAEARTAASAITADAQRAATATIASIQQSVTGAVSDAAHKISSDFASLVNHEVTAMTENFKQSHPQVTQAVTDIVGYANAVSEVATSVLGAAEQINAMLAAVRDIREEIRGTGREAGKFDRELETMGTEGANALGGLGGTASAGAGKALTAIRDRATGAAGAVSRFAGQARGLAGAVGGAVRSLGQLAAGYARAAVQAAISTARTLAMNVAQKVVAVATRLWAAAQALLNLAMRLNPVGLIITAITIFVGLIVLAYQRSGTFRAIVQAAMRAVSVAIGWVVNAAKVVVRWIKDNWPLLLAILTGPIGFAVVLIIRNWDRIKEGAVAVKNGIVRVWDGLVDWLRGLGGRIAGVVRGMWDGIWDAFRAAVNLIIGGWNSLQFHIPGFSLGPVHFGGFTLGVPPIQELAQGALVPHRPGGVLALLGEGGEDELVVPLSRIGSVAGGLARNVTVNVYPRAGQSEYEIGRIAARELAWAAKH